MSEKQGHFQRAITLFDAVMIVTGSMIGSGIFIVSTDIARKVGSTGWLLVVWLVTGVITLAGAVSYGELSSMFPKVGGQYVYLREAYNKLVAFLYGWTLFLVIQTGVIAAVAVAFARFTGVLIPWFSESNVLVEAGSFTFTTVQLLAIGLLVFLTYINSRGVRSGKLIANVFGSTKLVALALLILCGIFFGINEEAMSQNFQNMWQGMSFNDLGQGTPLTTGALVTAIGLAMTGSLFSSDSWNNIGFSGDEIVRPERTIVLSMALGTAIVTALYLLINVVYLLVLPLQGDPNATDVLGRGIMYATNERVGTAAAESILGAPGAYVMAVLIMISTFSADNSILMSGARAYYAMARDGVFFPGMGRLNKAGVPSVALWAQCAWACGLCLSGSYNELLLYVMFSVILFYIITIIGIFILRRTRPEAPRPYRAFGYPVVPLLYVVLASAFCFILLTDPENSKFAQRGLLLVALGIPVYFLFGKRFAGSPEEPQ
ncbi:APA family basic amino acid/polyamine antiporter [Hymenobacter luteus]|uniref:APA family basic amino acid/polyamine antiporter n=2 Tax=Hymenobacter TaxID=89966 RepID=A0A7W9T249_9BACT|nr:MULTISPECIES: amino acid permease [Hymenobacter]MBB4602273.1 APA family basic amino acid/polyamine antiporter [Hymenobacter latericoloratus]MBB6059298.1 APA family basic amino acid/polyamine antiporter [Hymenobacter luteus]